jgi:hypothetical protein
MRCRLLKSVRDTCKKLLKVSQGSRARTFKDAIEGVGAQVEVYDTNQDNRGHHENGAKVEEAGNAPDIRHKIIVMNG